MVAGLFEIAFVGRCVGHAQYGSDARRGQRQPQLALRPVLIILLPKQMREVVDILVGRFDLGADAKPVG